MKIMYLGDIMGKPGRDLLADHLSDLRLKYDIDIVVAQSENVTHGKGLSLNHYNELRTHGVDVFSGGNHTFERLDTMRLVADRDKAVTAPLNKLGGNYPKYKLMHSSEGVIFIASIMGTVYPDSKNADFTNQLDSADYLIGEINNINPIASIINFHGDLSSEKVIMGHYLDGKVTAVIGDHWHIPTADYRILPGGTAHITDVGMCGTLDSSLGASFAQVVKRWKTGKKIRLHIEEYGPMQINAVIVEVNSKNHLAKSINQLRIII